MSFVVWFGVDRRKSPRSLSEDGIRQVEIGEVGKFQFHRHAEMVYTAGNRAGEGWTESSVRRAILNRVGSLEDIGVQLIQNDP